MIEYAAYFKMPKCASTTLMHVFKNYKKVFFFNTYKEYQENIELKNENVLKFTTCRDPYTRAISSWRHCIRELWIPKEETLLEFLDRDFKKNNNISYYSMPQSHFIHNFMQDDIHNVLKIEDLANNIKLIISRCDLRFQHANRDIEPIYKLNKKEIEKIKNVYEIDFVKLHYDINRI